MTLGIDLGGTSIEVLRELMDWKCQSKIIHNSIPYSTFHPKIYLFESDEHATLFIGSNNFTDGGMYSNYEAYTRLSFNLPDDLSAYKQNLTSLGAFIFPSEDVAQRVSQPLLESLFDSKLVPSETKRRSNRINRVAKIEGNDLFESLPYVSPPSFPKAETSEELDAITTPIIKNETKITSFARDGDLLWSKVLSNSDSLQTRSGSNSVGGVRLTQAKFKNKSGEIIDQTSYFYELFHSSGWEAEYGHTAETKVHTFISARIIIRDIDYGVRNFEVSHKPSGEANQGNYTTMFRWGRTFTETIVKEKIAGLRLNLCESTDDEAQYLIYIE